VFFHVAKPFTSRKILPNCFNRRCVGAKKSVNKNVEDQVIVTHDLISCFQRTTLSQCGLTSTLKMMEACLAKTVVVT